MSVRRNFISVFCCVSLLTNFVVSPSSAAPVRFASAPFSSQALATPLFCKAGPTLVRVVGFLQSRQARPYWIAAGLSAMVALAVHAGLRDGILPGAGVVWAGAVVLPTLHFNGKNGKSLEQTWLVGQGAYGFRKIPESYAHLLAPQKEAEQLLELLKSKSLGAENQIYVAMEESLAESTPEQLTQTIGELRHLYLEKVWKNPDKRKLWETATTAIDKKLEIIQNHWGSEVARQVRTSILQLETFLPLTGEGLDNYERYITDMPHGLLHSLTVIDESLKLSSKVFKGRPEQVENSQGFFIGTALYHDLTGLRNRSGHHETARDLAKLILPAIHDAEGHSIYSPELVEQIAMGCYRHRGQKFPKPVTLLEKIFVDVDEYILIDDLQRILDQPFNKVFQPEVMDVYRRYIIEGKRKAMSGVRFEHETRQADLFQFLMFTLIERTNPKNYATAPAREHVQAKYEELKPVISRLLQIEMRSEVRERKGALIEISFALGRMRAVRDELMALSRNDAATKQVLREEIGTHLELSARVRELRDEFQGLDSMDFNEGALFEARNLLLSTRKPPNGVFRHPFFKAGRSLLEVYLENSGVRLADGIQAALERIASEGKVSMEQVRPLFYAGFAYNLTRIIVDRLGDLFRMVRAPHMGRPNKHSVDKEFAYAAGEWFLRQIDQRRDPNSALSVIRQSLDRLRNKRERVIIGEELEAFIRRILAKVRRHPTSNMHLHTSGALTAESIAEIYRENPHLIPFFEAKCKQSKIETPIDPRDSDALRQLFFPGKLVDSPEAFERPFIAGHTILNNDPSYEFHRLWYRQVVRQGAREGNRLIAVVSTFGQEFRTPSQFESAVAAATDGLIEGEKETGGQTRAVLLFALRKTTKPERAMEVLNQWLTLKEKWTHLDPFHPRAGKLFGIDSVGFEIGSDVADQIPLLKHAHAQGQWVKYHVGESWEAGHLHEALLNIQRAIRTGVVDQITNSIALAVDPETLPANYPRRSEIGPLQLKLIQELRARKIFVELSPTSNEYMSKVIQRKEGWRYRTMSVLLYLGLPVVITDDDPGLFDTNFAEEHLRLMLGVTPYGVITEDELDLLLKNSETVLRRLWARNGFDVRNYPPLPSVSVKSVEKILRQAA